MKQIGKRYLRRCKACQSEQEMIYCGPLIHEENLDKIPDPDQFKDLHLYVCTKCQTSLSLREPEDDVEK